MSLITVNRILGPKPGLSTPPFRYTRPDDCDACNLIVNLLKQKELEVKKDGAPEGHVWVGPKLEK